MADLCTSECVSLTWCATPRVSSTRKALGQKVMALPSSRGAGSRSSTTAGMPSCSVIMLSASAGPSDTDASALSLGYRTTARMLSYNVWHAVSDCMPI